MGGGCVVVGTDGGVSVGVVSDGGTCVVAGGGALVDVGTRTLTGVRAEGGS